MCTVTLTPPSTEPGHGWTMRVNRDESRLRPQAFGPIVLRLGERRAVAPIDPTSRGTWVGVNDLGFAVTLLNRYVRPHPAAVAALQGLPAPAPPASPAARRRAARPSRGWLVMRLLRCRGTTEADEVLGRLPLEGVAAFRLVAVDDRSLFEAEWSEGRLRRSRIARPDEPRMWTSSGLGDTPAERARRGGFRQACEGLGGDALERSLARLHAERGDEAAFGISMERPDALTRSFAQVTVFGREATIRYVPGTPSRRGTRGHVPRGEPSRDKQRSPREGSPGDGMAAAPVARLRRVRGETDRSES